MKSFLSILCCFLISTGPLLAQETADIILPELKPFCQPGCANKSKSKGIVLSYQWNAPFTLSSDPASDPSTQNISDGVQSNARFLFKFKVPVLLKEQTKILLGFKYSQESFTFDDDELVAFDLHRGLNNTYFRSTAFTAYLVQSFRGKNYIATRLGFEMNGDYRSIGEWDKSHLNGSITTVMGIKPHQRLDIGVGFNYGYRNGRNTLLPLFNYYQTFSEKWGIESTLPVKIAIRHNISPKSIVLAKVTGTGNSYFLKNVPFGDFNELAFQRTDLLTGLEFQQNIASYLWLGLDVGYRQNLRYRFDEPDVRPRVTVVQSDSGGGIYFDVSLFLAAPDKADKLKKLMKSKKTGTEEPDF